MKQITGLSTKKHDIQLETAKKYIKDFRNAFPAGNKDGFPHSEAFNKASIMKLMDHEECTGLRIFSGLKKENDQQEVVFILMGIDKEGKNILSTQSSLKKATLLDDDDDDSPTKENGTRHPPYDDDSESLLSQ